MLIAGLDVGTTGCKITVFNEKGTKIYKSYSDYPIKRDSKMHEIDAMAVLDGVFRVIGNAAKECPPISGIGVTSFGETFIMTDAYGTPLRNSMLYTDPRGSRQSEYLTHMIGEDELAKITGVKAHEMYSIPKIMWIKENEPEIYNKTKYIFLMEDFIVFHLTGLRKIDYSLASRTMGFDINKLKWSNIIFDAADIDIGLMSQTVPTGTIIGPVTELVEKKTGLSAATKIVCVSHDQIAAAVGAGVFDTGIAVDGAGTVECITPVFDSIPDMKSMIEGKYAVVPYAVSGKYVCYAFSYTGGALLQWCIDTIAKNEKNISDKKGIDVNELLEAKSESPTGILVLPHFAGAATPYMDTGSKGAVIGLEMSTTVEDIYRACMEGVVYEMAVNVEYLKEAGVTFNKLVATGGGAHSKEWMQMKADILNMEITSLETVDAGTVGSAMLTGVALGYYNSLEEAAKIMVKKLHIYKPRSNMHKKYMKIYERYRNMYQVVRKLI